MTEVLGRDRGHEWPVKDVVEEGDVSKVVGKCTDVGYRGARFRGW